tara:strand:- start:1130 stop:2044 length:915 start_codon:yes stop_codon:yes gene_type:complete
LVSKIVVAQKITIATFNSEFLNKSRVHIKFGMQFDIKRESKQDQIFWNDADNRTAKFEEASANVAQFIKKINADILTLTEVGEKDDMKVLINELKKIGVNYEYWEVCDCKDNFTKQHVAILSKYPLKEVMYEIKGRSIYLEEKDGDTEGETGISKGLKATVIVNEKEIDVFVMHFKSERGGFDSDAKRLAQATIARRSIIPLLNTGRNVVVTGDLNSEKKSESIYRIRGFDDIYEELIQTGNSNYFENTDVRWTYNYRGEAEQIDHILISPQIAKKSDIKTRIVETKDINISDHNPVIVTLDLK